MAQAATGNRMSPKGLPGFISLFPTQIKALRYYRKTFLLFLAGI
jgi:hypothetical protein